MGLVAARVRQMPDGRTVGHPMKDDILRMPRDAFPVHRGISDSDAESRETAGAGIRESAASSTSETHNLPDGLMDVPQVADYSRVSKTSVYKLIERQKIPAIRIGRLLKSDTAIGQSITPVLTGVIINVIHGKTKQIALCDSSLQSHVFSELHKDLFHSEQQVIRVAKPP